ncbi:DMT family transporter [Desulfofustis glycolicus]|uniref:Drug/metabolite transporter, DME family n=1 Tax=Desulfofustis glycolicus DSM 9705 TaxID=1121409 RepID=A0A1M5WUU5_9BACT|nr:EamA family transporter [Desulfofustis glycolicus]MCB2214442.1 EamA family transporter [Desulfobulbaceae bacterium]SHH91208.1 drug/metabolite transporter, DME family [Desulfofustis glycolicus DSM 9705]
MQISHTVVGMISIVAAAVLWGTTGTAQALAPIESTPQIIGALRLLVGGVALALVSLMRNGPSLAAMPVWLAVGGGLFVALYQLCFFWGVALTGVAVGTMVGIGSAPVFAGVLDTLFMKRRPSGQWYVATLMALLGCIILLGNSGRIEVHPLGIGLAAGAGLAYAVYTMFMKKLLPGRPPESVAAVVFCIGAAALLPFLFTADLSWIARPAGLAVVIHLGVLATALSYFLFCRGLEHVQVSTAVTLTLAEPFTAGLLGVAVLGEQVGGVGWIGLILILSGLIVLALPFGRATKLSSNQS